MSSSPPKWECDVFVSFKRADPVQCFTRDLLKRLYEVGIAHCSDKQTNAPGEFMGEANKDFQQVRFALVVLSDGSFDRLVKLLKGMKKPELVVIPICYPTVRADAPLKFAKALGKKDGEISGYDLKADSTPDEWKKLIDKIVERLVNEIFSRPTEKVFGPFGGKNETPWRSYEIKNGISLVYNEDGIKTEDIIFEVNGVADTKQQYGKKGQYSTYKVKFEKGEHITSFAGYFDDGKKRITCLIFRTSKRILRPFDEMPEECFYVPSKEQKVTKFLAGKEDFLTSIGAHVEQESKFCPVIVQRVGLIGKKRGYKWDDCHHHANVRKIIGKYDSKSGKKSPIQSIEFQYQDKYRKWWQSETHGPPVENNSTAKEIKMGENQHLTSILGVWEEDGEGEAYIKYLEPFIGKKCIDTIGVDEKKGKRKEYTISIPEGKIVGFYGWRRGVRLCGIGAYFQREPIRRGDGWDDKEFSGVRKICLWHDKTNSTHIRGIRFVYHDGSQEGKPARHGDTTERGSCGKEIILDYPSEYLTSISGCTQGEGDDVITSLIFHSNRQTYCRGLSVKEEGRFFWYPSTGSRITGFYGTFYNNALQSIGVYAEAIRHRYPLETIPAFGGPEGVDWDDGVHTDVRAFRVSHDDRRICSISFMYDDSGSLVEGSRHGGGNAGEWIWLNFPNERLTSITVWKSSNANDAVISNLKINTSARPYGPYPFEPKGKPQDEIKLAHGSPGRLLYNRVGFFGRAGKSSVNAIGAHYEPN